jgi:hypothetical protein
MQEPKYKIGQTVYREAKERDIYKFIIGSITIEKDRILYNSEKRDDFHYHNEEKIHPSLEALKAALHAQVDALEEPKDD